MRLGHRLEMAEVSGRFALKRQADGRGGQLGVGGDHTGAGGQVGSIYHEHRQSLLQPQGGGVGCICAADLDGCGALDLEGDGGGAPGQGEDGRGRELEGGDTSALDVQNREFTLGSSLESRKSSI